MATGAGASSGAGVCFSSYLRPLITIAPTAIRLGMPINTDFGFLQTGPLEAELLKPQYQNALIYIACLGVERLLRRRAIPEA